MGAVPEGEEEIAGGGGERGGGVEVERSPLTRVTHAPIATVLHAGPCVSNDELLSKQLIDATHWSLPLAFCCWRKAAWAASLAPSTGDS